MRKKREGHPGTRPKSPAFGPSVAASRYVRLCPAHGCVVELPRSVDRAAWGGATTVQLCIRATGDESRTRAARTRQPNKSLSALSLLDSGPSCPAWMRPSRHDDGCSPTDTTGVDASCINMHAIVGGGRLMSSAFFCLHILWRATTCTTRRAVLLSAAGDDSFHAQMRLWYVAFDYLDHVFVRSMTRLIKT